MRHMVLTRAVYAPHLWSPAENRRRLDLFRGVTARSLASCRRSYHDWRWVVVLHPADPLRSERIAVVRAVDKNARFVDYPRQKTRESSRQTVLESIGRIPWRQALDTAADDTLTTRVDDDDGFASSALLRIRRAADRVRARTGFVIPNGLRVWRGAYARVRHETNAWCSIWSPRGDGASAFDFDHRKIAAAAPVQLVDEQVGWLWARHADTLSQCREVDRPLDKTVTRLFDVDWSLLGRATPSAATSTAARSAASTATRTASSTAASTAARAAPAPPTYQDRVFWQRRHQELANDIRAVGARHRSIHDNEQEYATAARRFRKYVEADLERSARGSVLDIGYGFGHYARLAHSMGFRRYLGLDFASPPGPRLGAGYDYQTADFGMPLDLGEKFDLVIAIDVLYHIVDERRFETAIANIRRHARKVIYVTGVMRDEQVAPHVRYRSLERLRSLGTVIAVSPWRDTDIARIRTGARTTAAPHHVRTATPAGRPAESSRSTAPSASSRSR